jgi:hypothetical protein
MTTTTKPAEVSRENALESAVARALRDNLIPLQRTVEDLNAAYSDLISACSSSRPTNALPSMVRAQTAAASLSAALAVLSNFVTITLHSRQRGAAPGRAQADAALEAYGASAAAEPPSAVVSRLAPEWTSEEADTIVSPNAVGSVQADVAETLETPSLETDEPPAVEAVAFDISNLTREQQELHRRANRVAKVAMQDIKLLRPKDVRLGCDNKDICVRLRGDIDKARKEYDRRFRAILDHPVDYFHAWMVAILAEGDAEALGRYPYPSPVLRR